ncbi:MAG TPA: putative nucleotidyltransferase substrate binding domain-containing protein, partial [Vicinamibacteria bacterium]
VAEVMSSPLVTVAAAQTVFEALLDMTRRGIHHLPVLGPGGRLVGVVSSHDILLAHGAHPVAVGRQIEQQRTEAGLAESAPRIEGVVRWLAGAGAGALEIGGVVAELNDRVVARALDLAVDGAVREGAGRPPVPFSWLAAGSEGRREQTLKTDQDNGLVYEDPADGAPAVARYFEGLAHRMAGILERVGFPRCPGGYMAANPAWCQPASAWRRRFEGWMAVPRPEGLLDASTFCDLRPVGGDAAVGRRLWEWVCERVPGERLFLGHMALAALERHVPLGFFGGFVVERSGLHRGAFDIKARGVFPFTQAMRVYALSLGCRDTNSVDRLAAAESAGIFTPGEARDLREAHEIIARLRLAHQLARIDAGQAPDNFVVPEALGKGDRLLLRQAFRTVAWLQRHLEDRFQTSLLA